MKVLAFGEILWDVYPDNKYIGGAPLNFAAHFVRCGGESWLLSAVGNDTLGNFTLKTVKNMNVNPDYIFRNDKETGKCLVTLNGDLIPSYNILTDVAYDYIRIGDLTGKKFDVLYFGTLALRSENNRETLKQLIRTGSFNEIFVDMNIRPPFYSEYAVKFALENAGIIKISDEELPIVMKMIDTETANPADDAKKLAGKFKNLKLIIITKGSEGSFAYDCIDEKIYECNAEKVKVVSTVGAGDSFSAAFLSLYLNGCNVPQCLSFASKVSGFVVSKTEAIPEYIADNL